MLSLKPPRNLFMQLLVQVGIEYLLTAQHRKCLTFVNSSNLVKNCFKQLAKCLQMWRPRADSWIDKHLHVELKEPIIILLQVI